MAERRTILRLVVPATCLLIFVALVLYVAGYFALGTRIDDFLNVGAPSIAEFRPEPTRNEVDLLRVRAFEHEWLLTLYRPMATMEKIATGVDVQVRLTGHYFDFTIDDAEWGIR